MRLAWDGNLAVNVLANDVDVVLENRADRDHWRIISDRSGHELADLIVLHHRLIVLHQIDLHDFIWYPRHGELLAGKAGGGGDLCILY